MGHRSNYSIFVYKYRLNKNPAAPANNSPYNTGLNNLPLEFEFGPNGALYVVEYGDPYFGASAGTKLTKLEYTGTCRPPEPVLPPLPGVAVRPEFHRSGKVVLAGMDIGLQRNIALPSGAKGLGPDTPAPG